MNSLDNRVIQHAQGLSNTMNQVAGSFGTAVLVSVSALAPLVAPGASAAEQAYLGAVSYTHLPSPFKRRSSGESVLRLNHIGSGPPPMREGSRRP